MTYLHVRFGVRGNLASSAFVTPIAPVDLRRFKMARRNASLFSIRVHADFGLALAIGERPLRECARGATRRPYSANVDGVRQLGQDRTRDGAGRVGWVGESDRSVSRIEIESRYLRVAASLLALDVRVGSDKAPASWRLHGGWTLRI